MHTAEDELDEVAAPETGTANTESEPNVTKIATKRGKKCLNSKS